MCKIGSLSGYAQSGYVKEVKTKEIAKKNRFFRVVRNIVEFFGWCSGFVV